MRASNIIIVLFMIVGLSVLCGLGWWQVQRLYWKENLIETVENRIKLAPVEISTFINSDVPKNEWQYRPVTAIGKFDHSQEVYYYATSQGGKSGWNIHTPLTLQDETKLIVNRGFVPFTLKNPSDRQEGQVQGEVTISGFLRVMEENKPAAAFENAPEKREFYWRSLTQMVDVMKVSDEERFLPVILDANTEENPGGWPRGGTTIVRFSNSHLQYAGTWFGLALTLLVVGGYFLYTRREKENSNEQ